MRILVTGATGYIGEHIVRRLCLESHELIGWNRSGESSAFDIDMQKVELANGREIIEAFQLASPDVVIHLAALSGIDAVASDPERAEAINVRASRFITHQARNLGKPVRLIFASTDMVFDGNNAPYSESSPTAPTTTYGRQKAMAEKTVLAHENAVVVRFALTYGAAISKKNEGFFEYQQEAMAAGKSVMLFEDEYRTPIYVGDIAEAIAELVVSDYQGIINLCGPKSMSRLEAGYAMASALGMDRSQLHAGKSLTAESLEPRPLDLSLVSEIMPTIFPHLPRRTIGEALAPH